MDAPETTAEEAAEDLVDRLAEIGAVAHVIDRALVETHGEKWDTARLAVCGILRLASLACGRAMALADRLAMGEETSEAASPTSEAGSGADSTLGAKP